MWVDDGWPVKHDMIVLTQFKPSAIGHCLVGLYMVSNSSVTWVAHPRYRPSHGFWGAFALHISRFAVTEARTCSAQQDSMVLAFSRHSWHCSPPQPLQMLSMQDDTHASRGDKWVWKPNMWNPKKPNCCNLNAEKDLGNEVPHFSHKHTHTKGEQKLLPQFIQLQKWSFGPPGTADIAHPHSRGICFRCNRSRFRRSWAPTASSRGECGPWKHRLRGYQSYQSYLDGSENSATKTWTSVAEVQEFPEDPCMKYIELLFKCFQYSEVVDSFCGAISKP